MQKWIALAVFSFCVSAICHTVDAQEKVCVRNYNVENAISPCERFPESYTRVVRFKADDDELSDSPGLCTRIYGTTYCELSPKEYRWVQTEDHRSICTIHFDQKGVAELCKDLPDFYDWAQGAVAP